MNPKDDQDTTRRHNRDKSQLGRGADNIADYVECVTFLLPGTGADPTTFKFLQYDGTVFDTTELIENIYDPLFENCLLPGERARARFNHETQRHEFVGGNGLSRIWRADEVIESGATGLGSILDGNQVIAIPDVSAKNILDKDTTVDADYEIEYQRDTQTWLILHGAKQCCVECSHGLPSNSIHKIEIEDTDWAPLEIREFTINGIAVQIANRTDVTFSVGQFVLCFVLDDCTIEVSCCVLTETPPEPDPCQYPDDDCPAGVCSADLVNGLSIGPTSSQSFELADGGFITIHIDSVSPWLPMNSGSVAVITGRWTYDSTVDDNPVHFDSTGLFPYDLTPSQGTQGVNPPAEWSGFNNTGEDFEISNGETKSFVVQAVWDGPNVGTQQNIFSTWDIRTNHGGGSYEPEYQTGLVVRWQCTPP